MQSSRWNIVWVAPWLLVSWFTVELLVWLPLWLLGVLLMPVALRCVPIVRRPSWINPAQVEAFSWRWLDEIWGNHEDGLCPTWWRIQKEQPENTWRTRYTWFLRNSVDNRRFWPVVGFKPSPEKVRWIGSDKMPPDRMPGCFLAWQGPYTSFLWQTTKRKFWIGWRLNPRDRNGVSDYRSHGIPFDVQWFKF